MAGSPEVRGHVRLTFFTAQGHKLLVQRFLMVTQRKGGSLTMKTLEGNLVRSNAGMDGEQHDGANRRTTLSTKCSELDELLPRELGVPKAILENVIFCHQEDNNWPLSEPAQLKKKFDDIFEATKYTKCLASVKDLRKERLVQYKVDAKVLEALDTDCERATQITRKKNSLEESLVEKQQLLEQLLAESEQVTRNNQEMAHQTAHFESILNRLETLEERQRLHRDNLARLEAPGSGMERLTDSDAELQQRKDGFDEYLSAQKRGLAAQLDEVHVQRRALAAVDAELQAEHSKRGGLQQQVRSLAEAQERRQNEVRRLSRALEIRGYDLAGLTSVQIRTFVEQVEREARDLADSAQKQRGESTARINEATERLTALREQCRGFEAKRETYATAQRAALERVRRLQQSLDDLLISPEAVARAEHDAAEAKKRYEEAQRELQGAQYDVQIREKGSEARALEDKVAELNEKLKAFNLQADKRARIDLKKADIQARNGTIADLLATHDALFRKYTGQAGGGAGEDNAQVAAAVRRALDTHEQQEREAARKDQENLAQLQQVQSELSLHDRNLKDSQAQVARIKGQVNAALAEHDPENDFKGDLLEALNTIRSERDERVASIKKMEGRLGLFKDMIATAKARKPCITCNRAIVDAGDAASILAFAEGKIREIESEKDEALETKADRLAAIEQGELVINALERFLPRWNQLAQLESDIAAAKKTIEASQAQLTKAQEASRTSRHALEDQRSELERVRNLRAVLKQIEDLREAITSAERELRELEDDLATFGPSGTVTEVQKEIDVATRQLRELQKDVSSLQAAKGERMHELNNLERAVNAAALKAAERARELRERASLEKQRDDVKAEAQVAEKGFAEAAEALAAQQQPMKAARQERDALTEKKEKADAEADRKVESHRQAVRVCAMSMVSSPG